MKKIISTLSMILMFIMCSYAQIDSTKNVKSEVIFDVVEQQPIFPGGTDELYKFISKNFKYPKKCLRKNHQGKIYIQFVVNKDGSIGDVKILRGIDKDLDREAIRVVKSMPKWTPGMQKGKLVRVRYNLPINCNLN